jgi:hypothetical protein
MALFEFDALLGVIACSVWKSSVWMYITCE